MKLDRIETIMLLVRNLALEENKTERALIGIQIIDLLKEEEIEKNIRTFNNDYKAELKEELDRENIHEMQDLETQEALNQDMKEQEATGN